MSENSLTFTSISIKSSVSKGPNYEIHLKNSKEGIKVEEDTVKKLTDKKNTNRTSELEKLEKELKNKIIIKWKVSFREIRETSDNKSWKGKLEKDEKNDKKIVVFRGNPTRIKCDLEQDWWRRQIKIRGLEVEKWEVDQEAIKKENKTEEKVNQEVLKAANDYLKKQHKEIPLLNETLEIKSDKGRLRGNISKGLLWTSILAGLAYLVYWLYSTEEEEEEEEEEEL